MLPKKKKPWLWPALLLAGLGGVSLSLGLLMGYFGSNYFSGRRENERGWLGRSLRFNLHRWQVHFHHWLWSASLLASNFFWHWHLPPTLLAFFGGISLQGLSYRDWHRIFYRRR